MKMSLNIFVMQLSEVLLYTEEFCDIFNVRCEQFKPHQPEVTAGSVWLI